MQRLPKDALNKTLGILIDHPHGFTYRDQGLLLAANEGHWRVFSNCNPMGFAGPDDVDVWFYCYYKRKNLWK
eukprot:2307789-Rhodomonas_salina.1